MAANRVLYTIAAGPGKVMSIPALIRLTGQKLILPFYHAISDIRLPYLDHSYRVRSRDVFRKDLDFFTSYFQPFTLEELKDISRKGKSSEKPAFFLTFDDGLSSFYEVVAPELEARGLRAACFINPSFLDNKSLFYRYKVNLLKQKVLDNPSVLNRLELRNKHKSSNDFIIWLGRLGHADTAEIDTLAKNLDVDFDSFLTDEKPYLSTAQIGELAERGFYFGGHSMDHPLYSEISEENQVSQTLKSVEEVRKLTGQKTSAFSFPFTDHGVTASFFKKIDAIDLTFGTAGMKADHEPAHFQRIPMESTRHNAETIIRTEYLYYLLKVPFGKNKIDRHV